MVTISKSEMLEFLELPSEATDLEIKKRLEDKAIFFTRLCESAPNQVLKNIHLKNKEKVRVMQEYIDLQNPLKNQNHPIFNLYEGKRETIQNNGNPKSNFTNQYEQQEEPACYLIRHTENKPPKGFPLYPGENIIGRNAHEYKNTIIIEDDPYVSRTHAVIYIANGLRGYEYVIDDSSVSNNGKASKNGTYINANPNRVLRKTRINEGDTIQTGNTKFVLKPNNQSIEKIVNDVEESEYMKTVVIDIF